MSLVKLCSSIKDGNTGQCTGLNFLNLKTNNILNLHVYGEVNFDIIDKFNFY